MPTANPKALLASISFHLGVRKTVVLRGKGFQFEPVAEWKVLGFARRKKIKVYVACGAYFSLKYCFFILKSMEQQADDELNASIVLIDALLVQGKQGEAQKEMEAAQRLAKESQNCFLRLQFE